jgi:hypothetical protein
LAKIALLLKPGSSENALFCWNGLRLSTALWPLAISALVSAVFRVLSRLSTATANDFFYYEKARNDAKISSFNLKQT